MMKHTDIWRGLDRLADSFGYSPSGLAKKAGLDPTSFNKSKRRTPEGKPRWPSTESVAKVLHVTGATMSDFIALVEDDSHFSQPPEEKLIPVIGFAQAGNEGFFDEDGYPSGDGWDMVELLGRQTTRGEQIFGLKVSGNSMMPLYRKDDILILSPNAQTRRGDRVVVRTNQGEVLAKELAKKASDSISLLSLNPEFEGRQLKLKDICWIARIIWVSQ